MIQTVMIRTIMIRSLAIMLAVVSISHSAAAQRGGAPRASFAPHSSSRNYAMARGERSSTYRPPAPYIPYNSLPFPFFGDSFDANDLYSTGYPVASQPPAYVLQAASEMAGRPSFRSASGGFDPPEPSQPLMIELQNGRYIRLGDTATDGDAHDLLTASAPGNDAAHPPAHVQPATPPAAPLPVALVFRDGHSEEVRDYTIADGFLYARGDFYTDGYWNRKIDLASLNVPQTLHVNADRNVKFFLPSSPNEVITRP
jgi:hypothetical protein